jgi:hypothetical protein
MFAGVPKGGYEPHPLFPRDDDGPEERDICYVTFRRKRTDGRVDNCPEDIPAGEIQSWADVTGPWGGGEYKAIGKDRRHRIVAWYPPKNGEWLLFDQESKPFTLRNGHRYSPAVAPPAAPAAAPPSPPPSPTAPSATETLMLEILRELRTRPNPSAAPSPTASIEAVLVAMINAQGEMTRAALTAALSQRPAEGSTTAVELLRVMREWAPQAQAQGSMSDRLGEYKQIRELTTPAAVMPPPSEFGELKDMVMSVLQADALSKTTTREEPPPSPAVERRPPPPRRPLCYVPGVGMVDEADVNAVLSDPAARARVRNALGVEPHAAAVPIAPPSAFSPTAAGPAHMPPASAAPSPQVAPIPAPAPSATIQAPPASSAPMPTPPVPAMPVAAAPIVDVVRPEPPPPKPVHEVNIDALLADPVVRARVLKALAADGAGEASQVTVPPPNGPSAVRPQIIASAGSSPTVAPAASSARAPSAEPEASAPAPIAAPTEPSAPAPIAAPTEPSAPAPTAAPTEASLPAPTSAPTELSAPAPTSAPTVPIVTAALHDRHAPMAEPTQTGERSPRPITDEDRARAVPALRTIARMPRDQARAEFKKLPGMGDVEEIEQLVQGLGCMEDLPPNIWASFVAGLPAEAVRVLVDGPGG